MDSSNRRLKSRRHRRLFWFFLLIFKKVDDFAERRHQCFFFEKSQSKKWSTTCGKGVINVSFLKNLDQKNCRRLVGKSSSMFFWSVGFTKLGFKKWIKKLGSLSRSKSAGMLKAIKMWRGSKVDRNVGVSKSIKKCVQEGGDRRSINKCGGS